MGVARRAPCVGLDACVGLVRWILCAEDEGKKQKIKSHGACDDPLGGEAKGCDVGSTVSSDKVDLAWRELHA